MALTFLTFFAIGRIIRALVKKQIEKNRKNINSANSKRASKSIELQFFDDTELAYTILTCIANNEHSLLKYPKLAKIIFSLIKDKMKEESLALTPNMIRYLALRLINNNESFIIKVKSLLTSSKNRVRLITRISGSAIS